MSKENLKRLSYPDLFEPSNAYYALNILFRDIDVYIYKLFVVVIGDEQEIARKNSSGTHLYVLITISCVDKQLQVEFNPQNGGVLFMTCTINFSDGQVKKYYIKYCIIITVVGLE